MSRLDLAGLVLGCSIAVAGCGGAAAASPEAPEAEPAPGDLNAWLERLADSERELDAQLGAPDQPAVGVEAGAAPPPAAPPPPPSPAEAPAEKAAEPEPADARERSPCDAACRALGSMQRSAERICDLTGTEDARCSTAKSRVSRAEARVARAGCGCES